MTEVIGSGDEEEWHLRSAIVDYRSSLAMTKEWEARNDNLIG